MLTNHPADRLTRELAAELTDAALAILTQAGVRGDSVAMELAAWDALADALGREARLARVAGPGRRFIADGVVQGVVSRAVLEVAGQFGGEPATAVRPLVAQVEATARQRSLLARLVAPAADGTRPLGRSGLTRRLTVTALN